MRTTPPIYCLRSTVPDRSEVRLRHTYILLTELKAVFRRLTSQLRLRPIALDNKVSR